MYLKKQGLIEADTVFPGRKLADRVGADAADKLGLDRNYVDLSDVGEDDITVPEHTASSADETSDEEDSETDSVQDAAPVRVTAPQESYDDSLSGDGAVETDEEPEPAPEKAVIPEPVSDSEDKPEPAPEPLNAADNSKNAAEVSGTVSKDPQEETVAPSDDDEPDLFSEDILDPEEDSESDFEPGIQAQTIDIAGSRTLGSVASEEFFNDEN